MSIVSKKQPLYDQLVVILREKIDEMSPGEMLPSERELCERHGLSRTTVRLALAELEQLGVVVRKHGIGTFVADDSSSSANELANIFSFTEWVQSQGKVPTTKMLAFGITDASKRVAEKLGIQVGDKVYRMRRLRIADKVPMIVERTYLPADEFSSLSSEALASQSLYEIVETDYHQKIRVAREEAIASTALMEESRLLGIPEGSAVLKMTRVAYNDSNRPIEFTQSTARADQFFIRIVHQRG